MTGFFINVERLLRLLSQGDSRLFFDDGEAFGSSTLLVACVTGRIVQGTLKYILWQRKPSRLENKIVRTEANGEHRF